MIEDGFYCMDCFDGMAQIDDKSIDMILCDLPYGTTQCSWDVIIPFEPLWDEYKRIIKDNGCICLFSAQPFTTDLINSNRKMFRYEIVWEKTQKMGFLNANKMPLKGHENILIFYRHLPTYNPQKNMYKSTTKGRVRVKKKDRCVLYGSIGKQDYVDTGERFPHDVIHFSNWNGALFGNTQKSTIHPTQKPVDLLEYLIKTYTNEGDLVLDNCAGSCSTGIACHNTGRRFIGFEKDEFIFEMANRRLEDHKSQMTLFDLGMERK